jgi:iron complex outermembrane receptor protein
VKFGTDHTVRLGLEYHHNADDSGSVALGTVSDDIYAASLMWDWQVTPDVGLTNAIRVDHLTLDFAGKLLPTSGLTIAQYDNTSVTEPSFNTGAVWRATGQDTIRFSLARGVQLPTMLDYALQLPKGFYSPLVSFSGQPDLSPSIVWNAEVDYDRALPAIGSVLRTALFANRLDDILSWPFGTALTVSPTGAHIYDSRNIGYSTAVGSEIELKGHSASGFRWNASYALAATTDHTPLDHATPPTSIVTFAHSTPEHVVIGGLGYTRDRLELDVMGRWQSSFLDFRTNPQRTALVAVNVDNYVTMTARIGYRVTDNLTVALTAQQFNQSQLVETAGPPVERSIIASLTLHL